MTPPNGSSIERAYSSVHRLIGLIRPLPRTAHLRLDSISYISEGDLMYVSSHGGRHFKTGHSIYHLLPALKIKIFFEILYFIKSKINCQIKTN